MAELTKIKQAVRPTNVLLVVDAMTGQDAVNVAEQFAEAAQFDGVILSKLDGDARGGAALSVKAVTGKPILFASTGEKLENFERFHPDRMAQRILGMGDVLSFIEKAEKQVDEDEAKALERKLRRNEFTLEDFLDQLQKIRKMGPLTSLLGMMPGLAGHQLSKMNVDERELDRVQAIITSMTALGAPSPRGDQGLPPAADRQGLGHERPAGQPAGQAVRGDAQADEGALEREDARSRRPDAPALSAEPGDHQHRPERLRRRRTGCRTRARPTATPTTGSRLTNAPASSARHARLAVGVERERDQRADAHRARPARSPSDAVGGAHGQRAPAARRRARTAPRRPSARRSPRPGRGPRAARPGPRSAPRRARPRRARARRRPATPRRPSRPPARRRRARRRSPTTPPGRRPRGRASALPAATNTGTAPKISAACVTLVRSTPRFCSTTIAP